MTSLNPRADIYGPKTLSVMDQAFAAVWRMLRADDSFRNSYNDSELRIAIGHSRMDLGWGYRSGVFFLVEPLRSPHPLMT